MNIGVGTTNRAKLEAVKEILQEYTHLSGAEVVSVSTQSGVKDQPLALEETIRGAKNRAQVAYEGNTYGIGIESGLMEVPHTKSGYMDVCACAIFDGSVFHVGLSSAWEFPDVSVTKKIVEEGLDMSQAINAAGMTNNPSVGAAEGAIGILTKGRVDRKEYSKQALRMALIHIDTHE